MAKFGRCSDSSCTENAARLFECAHHCKKLVCLQHLIEHDQLIEQHQKDLQNLQEEFRQVWSTYNATIDETKLQIEFEEKLKRHQQLLAETKNLIESDVIDIEQCRIVLEKLKQNIEQYKGTQTVSPELPMPTTSPIEQIKVEPIDETSADYELETSNVSLTNLADRSNISPDQPFRNSTRNDSAVSIEYEQQSNSSGEPSSDDETNTSSQTTKSNVLLYFGGECPFWLDGAFGLSQELHGMYLCERKKYRRNLFRHLLKFHKLTRNSTEMICQAIRNRENPLGTILFKPNDVVLDQVNHFLCPFSIHNNTTNDSIIDKNSERPCRSCKPQFAHSLRYHFLHTHQMSLTKAEQIIRQIKLQTNENEQISNMSNQCEECSTERVFPCLYHCQKMLCLQHLGEHEEKMLVREKLKSLWNSYELLFNPNQIQQQIDALTMKLEHFHQIKREIQSVFFIENSTDETDEKVQCAMETMRRVLEHEIRTKSILYELDENRPTTDELSFSSSIATNDESIPSFSNPNGSSPTNEDEQQQESENEFVEPMEDEHHQDERKVRASDFRSCCPLIENGAFGIETTIHRVRLCSSKRSFRLHEHFRRVHHLKSSASLKLVRAMMNGDDPKMKCLFDENDEILNVDELREVSCPLSKPFVHYPSLQIVDCPCYERKQYRQLRDHLQRVHKLTNRATSFLLKAFKSNRPIHSLQFPHWINILQTESF